MPPADSVAQEVARLYALAPDAFVAERNAVTKAWKRAGRKGDAAVIAGLRKPSVVESALDRTAQRDPATTRAWAEAARRADEAQSATIGGGDAADLRRAMAELRTATVALVDAAVQTIGDDAKRDDIAALLRAIPAGGVQQVVAGVLGSATLPDDELFAGAPTPPRRSRPAKRATPATRTEPAGARSRRPAPTGTPAPPPAPRPSARQRKLEATVEQRQRAFAGSDLALDSARREVDEARARLAEVEAQRERAAAALGAAESELRSEVEREDAAD